MQAAWHALRERGIEDVVVIGLAKRLEEVWMPGTPDPIILPRSSEGLYLLQRMRDEAHRVAIGYQRRTRKSKTRSALHDNTGLGKEKAKALMRTFGSVAAVRRASVDELMEVDGIGPQLAERITGALAAPSDSGDEMLPAEVAE